MKDHKSILFFLGGALFDYNLKIAKTLRQSNPDVKLSAFVCGRRNLLENVHQLNGSEYAFNRCDYLNDMITQWLDREPDYTRLDSYRKKLGDDKLRRIITADREIGYGYIHSGYVEKTRLIKFFERHPEKRWSYIIGLLDYCFDILNDQKPNVVYLYGIAGADAIALYFAAHSLGIPAVQLSYARLDDYYLLDSSERMMMPEVRALYHHALENPHILNREKYNIASTYIDNFIKKPVRPLDTADWIKKINRENSLLGFIRILIIDVIKMIAVYLGLQGSRGIWRQRLGHEILRVDTKKFISIHQLKLKKFPHLDDIIKSNKFVYYPLHVDPEATTMVMADKLTDQLSVIEHLSKQIPAGWKIVVKDHIPMIGKRPKEFFERLENIPDVYSISPFEDNFKCIKYAETIVTLTGTAGWEGMLLGKVPIVMGYPHYINLEDGFVHCKHPSLLGDAIKTALSAKPINPEKMKIYSACMLQDAFELSAAYFWFKAEMEQSKLDQSIKDLAERLSRFF